MDVGSAHDVCSTELNDKVVAYLQSIPYVRGQCIQVCAYKDGEKVVSCWAGRYRQKSYQLGARSSFARVSEHTLFPCYSVAKGFSAAGIQLLLEQGRLDVTQTVASRWPAFAANGKQDVCPGSSHGVQGLSTPCLHMLL